MSLPLYPGLSEADQDDVVEAASRPCVLSRPRAGGTALKTVLILGVNGFIGSALTRRILSDEAWSVTGVDLADHRIADLIDHPRFNFLQFDLRDEHAAVDRLIAASDVVLPLAAYATPAIRSAPSNSISRKCCAWCGAPRKPAPG
jgi:FlaA1/EpsC-like NDP-sugar epimerase